MLSISLRSFSNLMKPRSFTKLAQNKFVDNPYTHEETNRQFWNQTADWYTKYASQSANKVYKSFLPFLELKNARRVLEAGGGPGNGVQILLEHANSSTEFVYTDLSDTFVEIAKSKNLPRTKCIRANAEKLPFDNEYVDRYVSNLVLEIVEDPVAMMMDAYRVLTMGGILAFSVFGRHGTCNQMLVQNRILTLARLPKAVIFTQPINVTWDLANPVILKELAKEAGFSKTFTYYEQYHYPYENVKDLKNFFLESPFLREPAIKENRVKELEEAIDTELNRLLEEEETPLTFEALVLIANKN